MSNSAQSNWDDLKFVLAVADHGSVSSAARLLGVNHATVLRRIAAFESRHGLRVFERSSQGYQVLADRRALIDAMRTVGDAFLNVERLIEVERPSVGKGIRVTSTESFCHAVLPPPLARMSKALAVKVEVLSGNRHFDFSRMQADLTVRPTLALPDDLAGEQAGAFRFGVYCSNSSNVTSKWIGLSGPLARSTAGEWMRRTLAQDDVAMASDSFLAVASLGAASGYRVLLPLFLGDAWPGLERQDVPAEIAPVPIWVATHVDLAQSGRLLKARRFLVEELLEMSEQLMA